MRKRHGVGKAPVDDDFKMTDGCMGPMKGGGSSSRFLGYPCTILHLDVGHPVWMHVCTTTELPLSVVP